jgi:hypothetical protein
MFREDLKSIIVQCLVRQGNRGTDETVVRDRDAIGVLPPGTAIWPSLRSKTLSVILMFAFPTAPSPWMGMTTAPPPFSVLLEKVFPGS